MFGEILVVTLIATFAVTIVRIIWAELKMAL